MEPEVIYEGEQVNLLRDGDFVTLEFGLTSVSFTAEDWVEIKQELKELVFKEEDNAFLEE